MKRRAVTFTIRGDIIDEARRLGINASRAAEQGLEIHVRQALEEAWLRDNAEQIRAHNERIAKAGMLIRPTWVGGS